MQLTPLPMSRALNVWILSFRPWGISQPGRSPRSSMFIGTWRTENQGGFAGSEKQPHNNTNPPSDVGVGFAGGTSTLFNTSLSKINWMWNWSDFMLHDAAGMLMMLYTLPPFAGLRGIDCQPRVVALLNGSNRTLSLSSHRWSTLGSLPLELWVGGN